MRRAAVAALVVAALAPLAPAVARAAPSCAPTRPARAWPAPLDRVVTVRLRDVPLRDALARVAAAARLRLSYSAEALPLDRAVCLAAERVTAGDALVELLAGTAVTPVVVGGDQVVLAPPRTSARDAADAAPEVARTVGVLDRVVVTGSAIGAPQRDAPYAIDVIEGSTLVQQHARTLAQALDAAVPGLWLWTQAPTSAVARYGSVRGASSFGVSAPKIYVDGIEVANPLLLTLVDPERVARVEVIRGPQGAALYGADAISGVVNVVTRQDALAPGAPSLLVRAGAGATTSDFASGQTLTQDHAFAYRAGNATRSAALGVSVGTLGAYVPGAYARTLLADGGVRRVGTRTILSGTLRFAGLRSGTPVSPLLGNVLTLAPAAPNGRPAGVARAPVAAADSMMRRDEPWRRPLADSTLRALAGTGEPGQSMRQYTLGGRATWLAGARWTHAAIVGVDGYRLAGVVTDGVPIPSATDSALRAARGGADRLTVRLSSTARLDEGAHPTTLVLALEQSTAREATRDGATVLVAGPNATPLAAAAGTQVTWWNNTGLSAQLQRAAGAGLTVTGGARLERTAGPVTAATVNVLPMVGAAWTRDDGPVRLTLRAAYGRGIRPPRTLVRGATWTGSAAAAASLAALQPESQAGTELGADLALGRRLGLRVTRFDQRASGLIQPVAVVDVVRPGAGMMRRVTYELQNVGAIVNRGWELQGSTGRGPLAVAATLSLVGSRVDQLARGYRGDLRPGDRMLEVPSRTMTLGATWTTPRWSAALGASRAADWVNYDRLALADALASGTREARDVVGPQLRAFWRTYPGVTRVRASGAVGVGRGLSLVLTGENLLNRQQGEPDNLTVLPGRTVSLGLRAGF